MGGTWAVILSIRTGIIQSLPRFSSLKFEFAGNKISVVEFSGVLEITAFSSHRQKAIPANKHHSFMFIKATSRVECVCVGGNIQASFKNVKLGTSGLAKH